MLYKLLVAPVKNPPVATNTTKPRSVATFLSFVSLSFLVQILIYCRQGMTQGVPRIISGAPESISGTPEVISGTPETISGAPETISGTPEVISGTPEVISGSPEIISGVPEMTPWGAYLIFFNRSVANIHLLLNNNPLFHT